MNGRIDITKIPFIGRKLAVWVHIIFPQNHRKLPFRKMRINPRQCYGMKGQVPSRKPRIFPFVGHGQNIGSIKMFPTQISWVLSPFKIKRHFGVAFEVFIDVKIIKLFVPQHSSKGLPLNFS